MAAPGIPINGQKLRAAMTAKLMSPEDLAELISCSGGHVRLMVRGSKKPSISMLRKLVEALEVTPAYLEAQLPTADVDAST